MVCATVRRDNKLGIIDRTGEQTMLYLTCTMISSIPGPSVLAERPIWLLLYNIGNFLLQYVGNYRKCLTDLSQSLPVQIKPAAICNDIGKYYLL